MPSTPRSCMAKTHSRRLLCIPNYGHRNLPTRTTTKQKLRQEPNINVFLSLDTQLDQQNRKPGLHLPRVQQNTVDSSSSAGSITVASKAKQLQSCKPLLTVLRESGGKEELQPLRESSWTEITASDYISRKIEMIMRLGTLTNCREQVKASKWWLMIVRKQSWDLCRW